MTMGNCKFCGKDAGLFCSKHKECQQLHENGIRETVDLFFSFLCKPYSANDFIGKVTQLQTSCFLTNDEKTDCAVNALKKFTDAIYRPFTHVIEQNVKQMLDLLNIPFREANKEGALVCLAQKIVKGYLVAYFTNNATEAQVKNDLRCVTAVLPLSTEDEKEACMYVLNKAAENFMKDGLLNDQEENLIRSFAHSFNLSIDNLPAKYKDSDLAKIAEMTVLKDFAKGVLPSTFVQLPILLSKNEPLLWTYNNVNFYQEKVEKEFVRNSGGFSFKVMKGVYYHTGRSKGHPIEHKYMEKVATGDLFVTNQNLIFYSTEKGVKIPYKKLVGITPYSDGIEVLKDGNSKRIIFQGFDSWFVMNLLSMVNV